VIEPGHIPTLFILDLARGKIHELLRLPEPGFQIENLCLQRDLAHNLFMYLLDERGTAAHWLVVDQQSKAQARHIRNLPIPPNSKSCRVDDEQSLLYIAEENVGIWAYPASAEAAPGRRVVDLAQPFGNLPGGAEALGVIPGGLVTISVDDKKLRTYQVTGKKIVPQAVIDLPTLEKPEDLQVSYSPLKKMLDLVIYDDADGKNYQLTLPWVAPIAIKPSADIASVTIASVSAEVQTPPMVRFGDAADDPAIWVHPKNAQRSLVLATNKKQGLMVYDLQGREVQSIPTGNINNVDLRYGFRLGKKQVDLAVASLRDDNSLALYTIDRKNGKISEAGKIPTSMKDIYGLCMYQAAADPSITNAFGAIYAIVNDNSGEFQEFLSAEDMGECSG
jgi:3-phytase